MAIQLQKVLETLKSETDFADKAISEIDTKLSEHRYVQNMVCDKAENPTFRFGIAGVATQGDKDKIIEKYKEAGWGSVIVTNSEENGERPGMAGVTLKQHDDGKNY